MRNIEGLVVQADGTVRRITLDQDAGGSTLRAMQDVVGGFIEAAPIDTIADQPVSVYVNEEGLLIGLPPNLTMSLENPYGLLVGDALIVGAVDSEGYDTSVPPEVVAYFEQKSA